MKRFFVNQIGKIESSENGMFVRIEPQFVSALRELGGFSHLDIFWWFDGFDNAEARSVLESPSPYKNSPEVMGIFATRSPVRPNLIALTVAEIINIDYKTGVIQIGYTDANDGSPVIDLKPYTPSMDRVENPRVPEWCSTWPRSIETSGDFNWDGVFNF